jgi:hypothetical protein
MRGRTPSGPESVEQLTGSTKAKDRVRVILQTMAGDLRVQEACTELDVCEQRIRQLRATMLQAAVDAVEDKPAGRPGHEAEPAALQALRDEVAELKRQLQAARLSAEIAVALPHVAVTPPSGPGAQEKNAAGRRRDASARRAGHAPGASLADTPDPG